MKFIKYPGLLTFVAALLLSSNIAMAGGVKDAVNQAKDRALQNAFSYGDSAIESWARDNLSSLRLIEFEIKTVFWRNFLEPNFTTPALFYK